MAWPVTTRATDDLITAAIWNADIAGNMNAVMRPIARRTTNQSVTSSTAFVSDDTLQLTVAANEVWLFHFHLRYDAGTTGDIKISFSLPASSQIDATALNPTSGTAVFQDASWRSITATDSGPLVFIGAGAGSACTLPIQGTYIGAGTAGTVILRWAQNVSDGTATRMLAQSTLWAAKLA